MLLTRRKLAARDALPAAIVFATRTGRPLGQRNVQRALRHAERDATDRHGRPTFPTLHDGDGDGRAVRSTLTLTLI